ncbi:hypothetical protein SUGI_0491090 [Cryptomeria japonica]|nr:hypothetical protein SUGI_0491090 [Cryptomeria japonica]
MHSLGFILYVIDSLVRPEAYEIRRYVLVERLLGHMDIGVNENGEEEVENDWGINTGELWILEDGQVAEEIAVGEAHSWCGPDFLMIAKALVLRRMCVRDESSSKDE